MVTLEEQNHRRIAWQIAKERIDDFKSVIRQCEDGITFRDDKYFVDILTDDGSVFRTEVVSYAEVVAYKPK